METLAFSIVLVLAMVAFSNFANGTLPDWLKAKFLNAGDPNRSYRSPFLGDDFIPSGSHSGPSARGFVCPVPGAQVISVWGDDRDNGARKHKGIDLGAPAGTPIGAAAAGNVLRAGDAGSLCGLRVAIRHGGGRETVYCHLNAVTARSGQRVRAGQTIGTVGNTGNAASTAPHLHFEIHTGGSPVDPAGFLPAGCGGR